MSSSNTVYKYKYHPLSSPDTIRVLTLHPGLPADPIYCEVSEHALPSGDGLGYHGTSSYSALSYTWGPPVLSKTPIWIDDTRVSVRPNLLAALEALRDVAEERVLWIDALCIDQSNVPERNEQVAIMDRIYGLAETVEVWLGDGRDLRPDEGLCGRGDGEAIEVLRSDDLVGQAPSSEMVRVMLGSAYWYRAWIVQEVSLAPRLIMHYGRFQMAWDDFADCCIRMAPSMASQTPALDLIYRRNMEFPQLLNQTLETLIRTYGRCECADRRDRIFAFLSLASDCAFGGGLRPDYRLTRLGLLVHTLEFCRPQDPVDLVSVLFRVLQEKDRDELWQAAADTWEVARNEFLNVSNCPANGDTVAASRMVKITQYIVAVSSARNWIRHRSARAAYTDTDVHNDDSEQQQANTGEAISSKAKGASSLVRRIDKSNITIQIHTEHFAIISTDQLKAVHNPCLVLSLHDAPQRCILGHCVALAS